MRLFHHILLQGFLFFLRVWRKSQSQWPTGRAVLERCQRWDISSLQRWLFPHLCACSDMRWLPLGLLSRSWPWARHILQIFRGFSVDAKLATAFLCPVGSPSKYTRTQRDKESSSILLCWEHLGKGLELFMEALCPLEKPRQLSPHVLISIVPAEEQKVVLLSQEDPALRAPD